MHQQVIHEGKKYPCRECDHQATSKRHLTQHQHGVHEGKKYPCRECDHHATSKGNLSGHQQVIHEGKTYPCSECEYQATPKSHLTLHQQAVHEGKKYPCRECDYQATTKSSLTQHQQAVHEGKSTHAGNVTTRLLQRVIFLNTNKFCIKGRNTFVICAAMKQLRITSLRNTRIECIGSQQYNHDAVACNYSRSMVLIILEYSFDGHL